MDKLLYVCNECDAMHGDEIANCQSCGSESIRTVPELELLDGMQWDIIL
ncbi:hypothetical protein JSQ81_11500 [Sporosarcina sp. Marseille-Q4063]|nr:hypothetical protein [Sporosarcina sp. Marseille-Q4063]QUW20486.1 hypothetical protein JSQ81_11500 [Sporosarcina sp. Marseille-Q4063]